MGAKIGMNGELRLESGEKIENKNKRKLIFEKLVWTVADVQELISCSERHIRSLVAEDKIPHFYAGRLLRFHKGQVLEWLLKGGTR